MAATAPRAGPWASACAELGLDHQVRDGLLGRNQRRIHPNGYGDLRPLELGIDLQPRTQVEGPFANPCYAIGNLQLNNLAGSEGGTVGQVGLKPADPRSTTPVRLAGRERHLDTKVQAIATVVAPIISDGNPRRMRSARGQADQAHIQHLALRGNLAIPAARSNQITKLQFLVRRYAQSCIVGQGRAGSEQNDTNRCKHKRLCQERQYRSLTSRYFRIGLFIRLHHNVIPMFLLIQTVIYATLISICSICLFDNDLPNGLAH